MTREHGEARRHPAVRDGDARERGRRDGRRDAGHDLAREAGLGERERLLAAAAEHERVAALLVARGWARATPAAIVVGAATPESWRWTGTLDGLGAAEIPPESREAPGLLVIGEVVRLADALHLEAGATAPGSRSLA